MKKLCLSLMLLLMGIFVWAGSSFAYTIDDVTLEHRKTTTGDPSTGWGSWEDRIGDPILEVFGIDVIVSDGSITFDLYTNFNSGGTYLLSGAYAWLADLALDVDLDGTYEYGVVLKDHDEWDDPDDTQHEPVLTGTNTGDIYSVTEWETSQDFWDNIGGFIYGGEVKTGSATPHDSYVAIKYGTDTGNDATVTFTDIPGTSPNYKLSVTIAGGDLSGLGEEIGVFWGGMTCSNDAVEGKAPIPEPATMLLFGTGLIGLAAVGRKKFFK